MRGRIRKAWTAAAAAGAVLFGLGFVHPFGDPRAETPRGNGALLEAAKMPAETKSVLREKCADCHSSETRWPLYARVAPGSWLIEHDVVEARGKMDLSRWNNVPAATQEKWVIEIAEQAKRGKMPPVQYAMLHRNAKLTEDERRLLAGLGDGAEGEGTKAEEGGDAARGEMLFERRCTGCHALNEDREGPRLAGVYGRKAGSVAGFNYSAGLKDSGLTWTEENLERWLSGPDLVVKDTKMDFYVPKANERRDLIAFLKEK
jgi:cytochrome c